jgi:hypothetical protein
MAMKRSVKKLFKDIVGKTAHDPARILLNVSRAVVSSLDPDVVSDMALKESRSALGADHASLFLMDEETGFFFLHDAIGFSADKVENIKLLGGWRS